jgi:hypothetical protein
MPQYLLEYKTAAEMLSFCIAQKWSDEKGFVRNEILLFLLTVTHSHIKDDVTEAWTFMYKLVDLTSSCIL